MHQRHSLAIMRRQNRLIELIRTGEFASPDLARKLKVSGQTVYRDIEFLKQRGYTICSVKHVDGWAYHLHAEPIATANEVGSSNK